MEMMTPNHKRWIEFYNKLAEAVEKAGCNSETDRTHARSVMKDMGFDDPSIEGSIKYLNGCGGHCDCEILMNVDTLELES